MKTLAKWFSKLCQLIDHEHAAEHEDDQPDVYLIDLVGQSGRLYCISFECDSIEDCELMLFDTQLDAETLGEFVEDVPLFDRTYH